MGAWPQNLKCLVLRIRFLDYFDRSLEDDIDCLSAFSLVKDNIARCIFFFDEVDKQFPEQLLAQTLKEGTVTDCLEMGFPGCIQHPGKVSSHYVGILSHGLQILPHFHRLWQYVSS